MARADIYTKLSLDRYARIMGINPVHFNGGNQVQLANGRILYPLQNNMNNIWPQNAWQNSDQISREDLAYMIAKCEDDIERVVGYYISPTWIESEEHTLTDYFRKHVDIYGANPITSEVELELEREYFIAGGRRKVTFVGNPRVTYMDNDTDTWSETARVIQDVTAYSSRSLDSFRFYFAGHDGDQIWEIRYPRKVWKVGNDLYADFDSWLFIDQDYINLPASNDDGGKTVDITTTTYLEATIDIYIEENDTTQNHAEFYTFDSSGGSYSLISGGYLKQYQNITNRVIAVEGTYDSIAGLWSDYYSSSDTPFLIKAWYYSGKKVNSEKGRYAINDFMPRDLSQAIAYMATARLERPYYANNNATSLADGLRVDLTKSARDEPRYFVYDDIINNPFGTTMGEVKAWLKVKRIIGTKMNYCTI